MNILVVLMKMKAPAAATFNRSELGISCCLTAEELDSNAPKILAAHMSVQILIGKIFTGLF